MRKNTFCTWERTGERTLRSPEETHAQACWQCGRKPTRTPLGWAPRLVELHDKWGRAVLCRSCLAETRG